jgi:hypothetical protein
MTRLDADDDYGYGSYDRHQPQPGPPLTGPPLTVQPNASPDPATSLERLEALHRAGKVTDAEFVAGKANILGLPQEAAPPVAARPRTRPIFKVLAWVVVVPLVWISFVLFMANRGIAADDEAADVEVVFATEVRGFTAASPAVLRAQVGITNTSSRTTHGGTCVFFAYVSGIEVSKFFESSGTFDRSLEPGEDFVLLASVGVKDQQADYVDRVTVRCTTRG